MFLLDTNTIAYFLRGEGRIAERLLAVSPSAVMVPAVVVFELRFGLLRFQGLPWVETLERLLARLQTHAFDDRSAAAAAGIRATLEKQDAPIGPYDLLIAGEAVALGATLVTRNQREFRHVPGLQLANWFE